MIPRWKSTLLSSALQYVNPPPGGSSADRPDPTARGQQGHQEVTGCRRFSCRGLTPLITSITDNKAVPGSDCERSFID